MTAGSRPNGHDNIFSGNMQDTAEAFDKFEDLKLDPTCGGDLDNIQLNDLAALIDQPAIYPKTEVTGSPPGRSYVTEYMPARPIAQAASYPHYDTLPDHGWTTAASNHGALPPPPYAVSSQPRVSNNLLNPYMAPIPASGPDSGYNGAGMGKAHSFPNVHTSHAQMPQPQSYTAYEGEWRAPAQQDPMTQVSGGRFSPAYAQRTSPYPEPPAYQFGCPPVMEERERSSSYPGVASPWSNSVYSPPIGQQAGAYCPSNYSSPPHSLTDLSAAAPQQPNHGAVAVNAPHNSQSLYTAQDVDLMHGTGMHSYSGQVHFRSGLSNPSSPLSASRETSPLTFNTTEWSEVMSEPNMPPLVNSRARTDNPFDFRGPASRAGSLSPAQEQIPLPHAAQVMNRTARRNSASGKRSRNRNGPRSARSLELWQFLYVVLTERAGAGALMWLDQSTGLFKVIDQERLSELWSDSKRRHRERTKVTRYSNLTRTLRYYYGRNLLRKGERDHVYQFLYDRMEPWISNRNLN